MGKPAGVLFLEEGYFSHSQHSLAACSSFCQFEASWAYFVHFGMSVIVAVQLVFRQSSLEVIMDIASGNIIFLLLVSIYNSNFICIKISLCFLSLATSMTH